MAKIYVETIDQIPSGEHWAILENTTYHIPSQGEWAPGHGYPAHNERAVSYLAFTSEAEFNEAMETAVRTRGSYSKRVRGIHVTETFVEKTVVSVQKAS